MAMRVMVQNAGFTLKELALSMLITAILSVLIVQVPSWQMKRYLDQEAASWSPAAEDFIVPKTPWLTDEMAAVGDWSGSRLGLSITQSSSNEFEIIVRTGTCTGQCEYRRTAVFQNGVLKTNKPIAHYGPIDAFDTIYLVKVFDNIFLVPASAVVSFNEQLEEKDYRGEYRPFGSLARYDGS